MFGYGPKSNIPENFDPLIGARPRKKKPSNQSDLLSESDLSVTLLINPSSDYPSSSANQETVDNSNYATPEEDSSGDSNNHQLLTNLTNPAIVVGPFPPLNSVREIKEFVDQAFLLDFSELHCKLC